MLIDANDSILLVIDLQEGFLKKLTAQRHEAIVDHCRFIVEVAARLSVPLFATVEDSAKNGSTTERVLACFDRDLPQRDKRIFGLCSQDDLRQAILAQPKRTAVLIGMDTDVCVLHSAVGLRAEGFRSVIVSDATGRDSTYAGGRYLHAPFPDHGLDKPGKLILDFNRLQNPPCAYTPYATCPLPPYVNRLAISIPAGEQRYSR